MARRRRRTDIIRPLAAHSPYERPGATTNTRNAGLGMNTRNAGQTNTRNAGQTNAVPGGSSFGSYRAMKAAGYVQRRDINGNIRWVDPKTGLQPDGSPLNPIRNATPQRAQDQSPDQREIEEIAATAWTVSDPETRKGLSVLGIDKQTQEHIADMPAQQADDVVHNASMARIRTHKDASRRLQEIGERAMVGVNPQLASSIRAAHAAADEYYDAVESAYKGQHEAARAKRMADADALTDYMKSVNEFNTANGASPTFSQDYIDAMGAHARGEITMDQFLEADARETSRRLESNLLGNQSRQPLDADQVQANMTRFNERYDGGRTYVAPKYSEGDDFSTQREQGIPGLSVQNGVRSTFEQPQETTLTPPEMQEPGAPPDNQQSLTEDEKGGLFQGTAAQEEAKKNNQQGLTEEDKEEQADEKGGDGDRFAVSRNFLATDRVPDTIFGYPVVSRREDYTPEDLQFFRDHPEAGGYYDLGEGSPDDGTEEGVPVQDDAPAERQRAREPTAWERAQQDAEAHRRAVLEGRIEPNAHDRQLMAPADLRRAEEARRDFIRRERAKMGPGGRKADEGGGDARGRYPGAWNNPGNVQRGEVEYDGETGSVKGRVSKGTFLTFRTPQDGLNAMAQSIGQMVREKIPAGQFTIDSLVKVYAPKKDANDVDRYAGFVSKWTGIPRDQVLDTSNGAAMALLLDAMVRGDSGHPHANWFTGKERKAAIEKMNTPARPRAKPRTEAGDGKKK